MKICTDLKQSKKLIELGIDIYTADMYWKNGVSDKYFQCFTPFVSDGTNIDFDYDIPAWSLTALLNILPTIDEDYEPEIHRSCNKYKCTYQNDEDSSGLFRVADNPVDAVFEIICWLKENKKI